MKKFALIIGLLLWTLPAFAQHTYYISYSSGSDTNTSTQAQSKSTPWQHLPGMATCASNCASYTPVAGDIFVLKGCDDWPNASFPINWNWGGSSGNPITVEADKTWYNTTNCASNWNRPIFDAGGTAIGTDCPSGSTNDFLIMGGSASYVNFNDIEAKGWYWAGSVGSCSIAIIKIDRTDYLYFSDWYIHDWTTGTPTSTYVSNDTMLVDIVNSGTGSCSNCALENSVIDNSDGNPNCGIVAASCTGGGAWISCINDVFIAMVNACKSNSGHAVFSGNYVYHIDVGSGLSPPHPNVFENVGNAWGGDNKYYIHDNYINPDDTASGSACETLQVGNNGEYDYVWNNIIIPTGCNPPDIPQSSASGSYIYFFNNTVVGLACANVYGSEHSVTYNAFYFEDNQCINSGASVFGATPTISNGTLTPNTGVTTTSATSQGYTASSTYVYEPTSSNCNGISTNCAIGAGANLTSFCSTSGLSGLCSDTVYAVSEQTVNGVVSAVLSGRTVVPRPSSGAWDAGAYQYSAASTPTAPGTFGGFAENWQDYFSRLLFGVDLP